MGCSMVLITDTNSERAGSTSAQRGRAGRRNEHACARGACQILGPAVGAPAFKSTPKNQTYRFATFTDVEVSHRRGSFPSSEVSRLPRRRRGSFQAPRRRRGPLCQSVKFSAAVGPPYVKVSNSRLCSGPSCVKVSNSRLCLGPPASNSPKKGRHFCQYFSTDGACQNLNLRSGPLVSNSQKKRRRPCGDVRASGPCVKFYPPVSKCQILAGPGAPTIPALWF